MEATSISAKFPPSAFAVKIDMKQNFKLFQLVDLAHLLGA